MPFSAQEINLPNMPRSHTLGFSTCHFDSLVQEASQYGFTEIMIKGVSHSSQISRIVPDA